MAGIAVDFHNAAAAVPGDGRPRECKRILDRDDNLYMNNGYLYLSNDTRVDLRSIIENPPGGGPTVVTSPATLTDLHIVSGAGSRTIKTTNITTNIGLNDMTVPNNFAAGDGNDVINLNLVTWPVAAPTAGDVLRATNATTAAWVAPSAFGVTSIANTAGAGTGIVVGGPTGAVTIKEIIGAGGLTVTNNGTDITLTQGAAGGVTSIANTASASNGHVVGGPTGAVTVKGTTGGAGITVTNDANNDTVAFTLLTTKGDLASFTTVPVRIPVGADTSILVADSTQAAGVKWSAPPPAGTVGSGGTSIDHEIVTWNGTAGNNLRDESTFTSANDPYWSMSEVVASGEKRLQYNKNSLTDTSIILGTSTTGGSTAYTGANLKADVLIGAGAGSGVTATAAATNGSVMIGKNAGATVTTPGGEVIIGSGADSSTTATDVVAIGRGAVAAQNQDVIIGPACVSTSSSGGHNVIIGQGATFTGTSGAIVIGNLASSGNANNVVMGNGASGGTSGSSVAVGVNSSATTGTSVALGNGATTGGANDVALGNGATISGVTGGANIAIGNQAAIVTTLANAGSISIGNGSQVNASNCTAIGSAITAAHASVAHGVFLDVSLATVIAASAVTFNTTTGQLGAAVASSKRFKKDFRIIQPGSFSDALMELTPVRHRYKQGYTKDDEDGSDHIGLLAEDVNGIEELAEHLVIYGPGNVIDREGEGYGMVQHPDYPDLYPERVRYDNLPILLLDAFQDLTARLEAAEARLGLDKYEARSGKLACKRSAYVAGLQEPTSDYPDESMKRARVF